MIDKMRIYQYIVLDVNQLSHKFKCTSYYYDIDIVTGEVLATPYYVDKYTYRYRGISISYYSKSNILHIEGKLTDFAIAESMIITLGDCLRDDIGADMEELIGRMNHILYELTGIELDIQDFNVSYIEVTFNLYNVSHVGRYIHIMNLIQQSRKDKRYINHVIHNNLDITGSLYLKSNSNYKNNTNDSYTINFYNKEHQLLNLRNNPRNERNIKESDIRRAKGVLRLEVQLGYAELKKTPKKLGYFLNIDVCQEIIVKKYQYFISRGDVLLDFYCYAEAKKAIEASGLLSPKDKRILLAYMEKKHRYNKELSRYEDTKYKKMLSRLGIHPYFIPTNWNIKYLESPIKKLIAQVEQTKKSQKYKTLKESKL